MVGCGVLSSRPFHCPDPALWAIPCVAPDIASVTAEELSVNEPGLDALGTMQPSLLKMFKRLYQVTA